MSFIRTLISETTTAQRRSARMQGELAGLRQAISQADKNIKFLQGEVIGGQEGLAEISRSTQTSILRSLRAVEQNQRENFRRLEKSDKQKTAMLLGVGAVAVFALAS